MDKSSTKEYYESLKQICIYLIGERGKAEYVLDMFYQQDVRVFECPFARKRVYICNNHI